MLKCFVQLVILVFISNAAVAQGEKRAWKDAGEQLNVLYGQVKASRVDKRIFPRSLEGDTIRMVPSGDWTSGFWPGMLWFMYEQTGNADWKAKAEEFTALMERESRNRGSHDVGFKVYNSYGNGYRLTKNESYKQKIIEGAETLVTRFNPRTGCIRSWDFGKWQYPVIIDNMMNLELLFAATRLSGDSSFYKVAVSHANTTLRNHFRPDNSCYHVVDYDTITGLVRGKGTLQGYSDSSSWARGQAWALYGFTLCFRETKDTAYLQQAERIAAFLLNHAQLPEDKIPYWDYDATGAGEPRDASAAAITASALYELQHYSKNGKRYRKAADQILSSLIGHYRAAIGTHRGFLLLHSTGHKPVNGEVDTPIIYGDYYFLESLLRKRAR